MKRKYEIKLTPEQANKILNALRFRQDNLTDLGIKDVAIIYKKTYDEMIKQMSKQYKKVENEKWN